MPQNSGADDTRSTSASSKVPRALYPQLNRVMALSQLRKEREAIELLHKLIAQYPDLGRGFLEILESWGWKKPADFIIPD